MLENVKSKINGLNIKNPGNGVAVRCKTRKESISFIFFDFVLSGSYLEG